MGQERYLTILPQHATATATTDMAAQGVDLSSSSKPRPTARAKQIWDWCQMDGKFSMSMGEIDDLLKSEQGLPADLQALVQKM